MLDPSRFVSRPPTMSRRRRRLELFGLAFAAFATLAACSAAAVADGGSETPPNIYVWIETNAHICELATPTIFAD